MAKLPSLAEMSLTPAANRPEDRAERHPATEAPSKEPCQTLPSIKEALGKEINARRPIAPQPPPVPEFYIPGHSELYLDGLPIRCYRIGKSLFNMQQIPNETRNEFSRITVDHRRITYTLEVVQQPEKARACGSGNKSSNDRRPVDPPPVVELKIYTNNVDTTMTYDATFMLYASLEQARPIAQGKMHNPTTPAVLAGVTVASAAYLDKPKRAAYFIFPDLSVRHEGWYRLRFSLFEGVKNDFDSDLETPLNRTLSKDNASTPGTPVRHEGVFNRMDVVSTPFQVFSAKKFPGLDQSTQLSVLVADQGCRVRIRRDVRQRKPRRQKSGAEGEDASSSYQGTPQATYRTLDHSRSASRNSLGSQYDRRESVDSHYSRPQFPSRQMSSLSMPVTSPVLPTPTSSMPPPTAFGQYPLHRSSYDNLPRPAPSAMASLSGQPTALPSPSTLRGVSASDAVDWYHRSRLPPLVEPPQVSERKPGTFYDPPAPTATKRPFSPIIRSHHKALKWGARDDSSYTQPYMAPALGGNDFIEADPNPDEDEEETDRLVRQSMSYAKSDGSKIYIPDR